MVTSQSSWLQRQLPGISKIEVIQGMYQKLSVYIVMSNTFDEFFKFTVLALPYFALPTLRQ